MVDVTPGDRLGDVSSMQAGEGTYVLEKQIYSSFVGTKKITDTGGKPLVEVLQPNRKPLLLPKTGDVVTCKVDKINSRMATVSILTVGNHLLQEAFPGTIRQRDVRAFEIDSVELYKSFMPGDLVRAKVLSLGNSKSYFLSTAENALGVVLATSTFGHPMLPISWEQMQCTVTKRKEYRKVANPKITPSPGGAVVDSSAKTADSAPGQ